LSKFYTFGKLLSKLYFRGKLRIIYRKLLFEFSCGFLATYNTF
jgi:hypothetical protein